MNIDGIEINFPPKWTYIKYDDWSYYKNRYQSTAGGLKASDIVAKDDQSNLWIIEVKDYRHNRREKSIDFADEIALKAVHTLSGIFSASVNAENEERKIAKFLLSVKKIRVALELIQSKKDSRIFPRIDPANLKMKMKQKLKSIDAHPVVSESNIDRKVAWEIECQNVAFK